MNLWYMDREKQGIFSSGPDVDQSYKRNRDAHFNKKSVYYGAVLVRTKRIKVGHELIIKLFYRGWWYWKPIFQWRYGKQFHWLCFRIWLNPIYLEVADEVVKDHLNETKPDHAS